MILFVYDALKAKRNMYYTHVHMYTVVAIPKHR